MKNLLLLCLIISVISCASKDVQKEQAQLHLQIGTGLLSKGQYPQALASLLQAEKLDPDNAEIQNNLGLAYFVRKEYESSLKHMNHQTLN